MSPYSVCPLTDLFHQVIPISFLLSTRPAPRFWGPYTPSSAPPPPPLPGMLRRRPFSPPEWTSQEAVCAQRRPVRRQDAAVDIPVTSLLRRKMSPVSLQGKRDDEECPSSLPHQGDVQMRKVMFLVGAVTQVTGKAMLCYCDGHRHVPVAHRSLAHTSQG